MELLGLPGGGPWGGPLGTFATRALSCPAGYRRGATVPLLGERRAAGQLRGTPKASSGPWGGRWELLGSL